MPTDINGLEPGTNEHSLPLISEEISVSRREIEHATISVNTITRTREEIVDEKLTHEHIEIVRIPIGRQTDGVPPIREEGDVTILSIVEEVVVVERRLVLKEEIHLRRVRSSSRHLESVLLREQDAIVTRTENEAR